MKVILLSLAFILNSGIYAQSRYTPITGGIEVGLGINTTFSLSRELENISYLPFTVGFIVNKYLSNTKYLETGILYGRYTAPYPKLITNDGKYPIVSMNCIDIPFRYYFQGKPILNSNTDIFTGIITSYDIFPETYRNTGPNILDESFRKTFLSLCGGISFRKESSRIKIQGIITCTSILKPELTLDSPCTTEACGGRLFPVELLVCYDFLSK